jgi:hypothetical protein
MAFMHRFLQHVLPKGFVKVRYYGFFSPGQRQILAKICHYLMPFRLPESTIAIREKQQGQPSVVPVEPSCPNCGEPLHLARTIPKLKQHWRPP